MSQSPRRVLKSVVGPALGATLAALLAGCSKESATTPAPQPSGGATDPVKTADPPPREDIPKPGMPSVNPLDAGVVATPPKPKPNPDPSQMEKPGKRPPNPGKIMPRPGPRPKVGIKIDRRDPLGEERRGTRRGTDPSHQAMGAGPRRVV